MFHALIKIIKLSYSLNSSATTVSTRQVTSIVIDALSECYKLFSTLITNKDLIHNTHPPISPLPIKSNVKTPAVKPGFLYIKGESIKSLS